MNQIVEIIIRARDNNIMNNRIIIIDMIRCIIIGIGVYLV
jgi:hypothetical protein